MFYLLHGEDEYSSAKALQEMKAKTGDPTTFGLNTTTLEGKDLTLQSLSEACDVLPLLSEKRLVVVHDLGARFKPAPQHARRTKDKTSFPLIESMRAYLPRIPESTTLIFMDSTYLSQANPLRRLISELGGHIEDYRPPKGRRLEQWITEHVTERGGEIEPKAVGELAVFVGGDLRLLDMEIEKLIAYAGPRPIQEEDVHLLVSEVQVAGIFALVDALGRKDRRRAMSHLHQLLEAGQHPLYILTMIVRQFRLLLQAKDLPPSEIQRELKLHPFVAQKIGEQVKNFSREELREAYHRLLETDRAIKTGRLDPALALDLLLMGSTTRG
jgi:DNA polymerase-3 subunit delta